MGEIVKFPAPRVRERIRHIRERHASALPEQRLDEIDERLHTIENAIAVLRYNRCAVLAEWHAEFRRVQAAERRQREEAGP